MDLSFSGAGFMGCYYFGVVACWNKYIPRDRVNRVAGASAGSLIAAYYLMDLPLSDCLKEIIAMTEDIRKRPLGVFDRSNQIVDILPKILDRVFPDDAHKRVGSRLYVCMTRLKDMKKVIVNEFESKQELIDALNCSCFIPVWSGNHVSTYKGARYIDGGFSDNLPVFDENTIRICCFAGPTDISPMGSARSELIKGQVLNTPVYLNMANARRLKRALTPPPASYILDLLERGFHDAKDFILTNDLIQCDTCYYREPLSLSERLPVKPTLTPSPSRGHSRQNSIRVSSRKSKLDEVDQEARTPAAGSRGGRSLPTMSSLSRHLEAKLGNYSPDSGMGSSLDEEEPTVAAGGVGGDANNNNVDIANKSPTKIKSDCDKVTQLVVPAVVVVDEQAAEVAGKTEDASDVLTAEEEEAARRAAAAGRRRSSAQPLSERFQQRRASQLAGGQLQLLAVADKFKSTLEPLPSCPPSPSLDRHCDTCLSQRQAARNDRLEDTIRDQAANYIAPDKSQRKFAGVADGTSSCGGLASPIKWLRHWRTKTSYSLVDAE